MTSDVRHLLSQHYYDVVYGGGDLMRRFHAEVSKDSDAQVSDWVDGVRSISFNMPVNVPLVMKKMIGAQLGIVRGVQRARASHTSGGSGLDLQASMFDKLSLL